jgi:ubiquinol oxidase
MIMESLGGDQPYWVRFVAQHSALAYYIALCLLWMVSPSLSYKFSELLETHAVDTYGQFVDENEDALRDLPPSLTALEYYAGGVGDPLFGEYQTAAVAEPGREVRRAGTDMTSLHAVFAAIRDDEGDHVRTMTSCLDPEEATLSVGLENRVLTGAALAAGAGVFLGGDAALGGAGVGLAALGGMDGMQDLDSILTEDGAPGFLRPILEGLAGLANEFKVSGLMMHASPVLLAPTSVSHTLPMPLFNAGFGEQ